MSHSMRSCSYCGSPIADRKDRYCSDECAEQNKRTPAPIHFPRQRWSAVDGLSRVADAVYGNDGKSSRSGHLQEGYESSIKHRNATIALLGSTNDRSLFGSWQLAPQGPEDRRLAQLTKTCLAFSGVAREIAGPNARFTYRTKPFAFFLSNCWRDGIVAACFRQPGPRIVELIESEPARYYRPSKNVGAAGWVAIRLDVPAVNWGDVGELAENSYRRVAGSAGRTSSRIDRRRQPFARRIGS